MLPPVSRLHAVGAVLALAACAGPAPAPVAPPAPPPVAPPPPRSAQPRQVDDAANRCASMVYRGTAGLTIERAAYIADGLAYALDGPGRLVGAPLPAHCSIGGRIDEGFDGRLDERSAPDDGRDPGGPAADTSAGAGTMAPVAFEMRLPTRWNGRYFHQGSDALDGPLPQAYGRSTGAGGLERSALSLGYAVLGSDAGRRSRSATGDPPRHGDGDATEAAVLRSAAAAKAIVRIYYGKPPDRSYFVGCGEGGREGLVFAQRRPQAFDGIVAVAPRLRETDAAVAAAWTVQRFLSVAPRRRGRPPVLSRALDPEQLFGVARAVLAQCDALDGAEDGFVMDMAGCRFDASVLACRPGSARDCLPADTVAALAAAIAGPTDAAGRPVYEPWPWDPGIAAPGWRVWTLGSAAPGRPPDARHLTQTTAALARLATAASPAARVAPDFEIERDLPRLQAARAADLAFADTPLEAFRQRQGRLLLVHGAADPVVSAWATIDYLRRLGRTPVDPLAPGDGEFARAFIVPGMNHCAGGPSTDRFDALSAIVDWVESDRPPDRIEARGSAVLADESRPLCPWPRVARYAGTGEVRDAAHHVCR